MAFWFERLMAAEACEEDKNPIVGDPARVSALAQQLNGTADTLKTQADRLRAVSTEQFWKGAAATEFMHIKDKLPPLLDKVVKRYGAVGEALAKYAPDLQQSQASAQRALQAYRDAKGQQQTAQASATQYNQLRQQAVLQNRPLQWTGTDPNNQLGNANQAVGDAIRMMTDAIDSRDAAASTCGGQIRDAIDDDLKNDDSFWGKLKKIGKGIVDALEKIAPILRKVAAVLGVAAALLCWVPVLGEVLAGAALVVSAASLAVDLTLKASGRDVSWGDIAMDAVGVIPFGKAARLAKVARPAAEGAGVAAKAKSLVQFGKSIVSNIGPAYRDIASAGREVLAGRATVSTVGQGAVDEFRALGGVKGVAKDIGPISFALTGNKIRGLFSGDGGASASATAPTNPAAFTSGLPVSAPSTATTAVTSQLVPLPAAA
ncbi:MAG: hypothetical protein V7637_2899 [Mycobacteriales bacterium]